MSQKGLKIDPDPKGDPVTKAATFLFLALYDGQKENLEVCAKIAYSNLVYGLNFGPPLKPEEIKREFKAWIKGRESKASE